MSVIPEANCNKCCKPATMMCQRCYDAYCSVECQVLDWKEHKHQCFQMPTLVPIRRILRSGPVSGPHREYDGSGIMRRPLHADKDHNFQNHEQQKHVTVTRNPLSKSEESHPVIFKSLLAEKDFVLKPKIPESVHNVSRGAVPKTASNSPVDVAEKAPWRIPFQPPKGIFFNAIVQWLEVENPSIYWVTEAKYDQSLRTLLTEINRTIGKDPPCEIDDLHVGALVAAPFDGVYYRAKVLKLESDDDRMVTVHLIDYGNQEQVPLATLRMPSPIMRSLNAYAIQIRLPKNCSLALDIESVIRIRLMNSNASSDGIFDVEIHAESVPLHVPIGFLTDITNIKLVKVFMGGHQALVQLSSIRDRTADINTLLNSEHGIKYEFHNPPHEGTFVAARTSEGWRRSNVLGHWPENDVYLVYHIDEGVVGICKQLKKLPDSLLEPMRILAISTSAPNAVLRETELRNVEKLTLQMMSSNRPTTEKLNSLPCTLFADERKISDVIATTFTGILNDLSVTCWNEDLIDGCSIYITKVLSHSEIFISSHSTKSYQKMFSSFASKCAMYQHDEEINEDDIVLASLNGNSDYFRAKVLGGINGAQNPFRSFKVLDIDTGYSYEVSRAAIRKPNLFVRSCPVYLKKVNLIYLDKITHPIADNKAEYILNQCKDNGVEFVIKFDTKHTDGVELLFKANTQQSLNKQLLPLVFEERDDVFFLEKTESLKINKSSLPPSPPNTPIVKLASDKVVIQNRNGQNTKAFPEDLSRDLSLSLHNLNIEENVTKTSYTISDVQVVPIQSGDRVSLLVLDSSFLSDGYITVCGCSRDILQQINDDRIMIAKYVKSSESERNYEPKVNEMCLGIFAEDNEWYRAICKYVCPDGTFNLLFLDYGNICNVNKNGILPIRNDLLFPTKANVCYVKNLPQNLSRKQLELFSASITNTIIICNVHSENDKRLIEFHEIDKYLK